MSVPARPLPSKTWKKFADRSKTSSLTPTSTPRPGPLRRSKKSGVSAVVPQPVMPPADRARVQIDEARLGRARGQARDAEGREREHERTASAGAVHLHVGSPRSASMRARSKPCSSRPRTSMMGTRSVGMPILRGLLGELARGRRVALDVLVGERHAALGQVLARRAAGPAPRGAVDRDDGRPAPASPATGGGVGGAGAGRRAARAARATRAPTTRRAAAARAPPSRTPSRDSGLRGGLPRLQQLVEVRDVDLPRRVGLGHRRPDRRRARSRARPRARSRACRSSRRCPAGST